MRKAIPYGRQDINQADIDAVVQTLKADFLTQGPKVSEFEEKFSDYIGSKYAVAVSNGTAALHLCALALDVNSDSKVITPPITFAASSNCIKYCGGEITFSDIDPSSITLDLDKVRDLLETVPKGTYSGIVPVDFAGHPVNMEAFRKLADEYNLWIIEDACHAPGGYFTDSQGTKQFCGNGKFADLAIFSFHPVKHIACGEGGMITTNSKELYEKLIILRTHGITKDPEKLTKNHGGWYMEMQTLGYNYRMPDILCALGISQLERATENIIKRRKIANKYDQAFADTKVELVIPPEDLGHAYHLYVIKINNRKELYDHLRTKQIYAQIHYIPTHLMPYYKELGHKKGDYPLSESYYDKCISLPMFPTLTDEEQDFVINEVISVAK
ncbi:MAG: UDP-4-amino-4,6-dideoxy-N-acetyl-beta-L-altrosamine transaminase [Saprospiraceae bacterium]|jgi:UDP-4-amino-4,6-dideoxy-N-acetyl-beta-L-altrosamine transaminase